MHKLIAAMTGLGVWAAAAANAMTPGGIAMQPANSALAEEVHFFHNIVLMPVITGISLFVLALLIWVVIRYNAKANPEPRKFSHNTLVEVIWTAGPILILLFIAIFSFDLLYKEGVQPDGKQVVVEADGATTEFVFANDFSEGRMISRPDHLQVILADAAGERVLKRRSDYRVAGLGDAEVTVTFNTPPSAGDRVIIRGGRSIDNRGDIVLAPSVTLKVTGNQWNWTYTYPDYGDIEYFSNMLPDDQVSDPMLRKLEVDNRVLVPVGETVRVIVTASDVIHSWAMPAFAIKIDAVPGRINETWFKADREGVYYGQCSEICGIKHSFMPIAVEVVSREAFCGWVRDKQTEFGLERTPEELAAEPLCGDAGAVRMADAAAAAAR